MPRRCVEMSSDPSEWEAADARTFSDLTVKIQRANMKDSLLVRELETLVSFATVGARWFALYRAPCLNSKR